jgi:hypothetical protein
MWQAGAPGVPPPLVIARADLTACLPGLEHLHPEQ